MSTTNIIIDGNYVAFATYSIFSNYGKDKSPLKKESDQSAFVHDLTNKVLQILNQLPRGGRVVFCVDSRSWRKELLEKYKESREDEDGNKGMMDNETKQMFYALIAELGEAFSRSGIIFSKVQGAEGDDLIFKWARHFNEQNENCIIISGDRDLTQIVQGPETPWNVVWTNKSSNSKLYAMNGWLDCINEDESSRTVFDFTINTDSRSILSMIRDARPEMCPVDVSHYVLHKILIGDDGDDVPSSWFVQRDAGKLVRVTDKKAETIITVMSKTMSQNECLAEIMATINGRSDGEKLHELSGILLRVMDDVDDVELRKKVTANILRNAKLVWLREEMLPFNVNEMINENIEAGLKTGRNDRVTKAGLLEGTRFGTKPKVKSSMDPFDLFGLPE